jgi:hypothetical protein
MRRTVTGLATLAFVALAATAAQGQAVRAIGGTAMLPGDDNYEPADYGFFINYFGAWSDAAMVCKNGYTIMNYLSPSGATCVWYGTPSVSATNSLTNLRGYYGSVMAPFFDDINTNFGGSVLVGQNVVDGNLAWGVTWNAVGGYAGPGTSTFQMVLIDRGAGDFTMEFNYGALSWGARGGIGFTNDEPSVVTNFTPTKPATDTRITCEFVSGSPTCSTAVVPEPSTFILMASALAGFVGVGRIRRRNSRKS